MVISQDENKYRYMLHTWGGFYNKHNKDIHGEEEGYKWFDTREALDKELERLDSIQDKYKFKDGIIARHITEGYLTTYKVIIQSIVRYKDKQYIIEQDLGFGFPLDNIEYMMEWKWNTRDSLSSLLNEDTYDKVERLVTTYRFE